MRTLLTVGVLSLVPCSVWAQRAPTPIRQSELTFETATTRPLTLRHASRNDRWLGLGVRDVRWAPDGTVVYFRWNRAPTVDDVPQADAWFMTDASGRWVERVSDPDAADAIPASVVTWDRAGRRAVWRSGSTVYLFSEDASEPTRAVVTLGSPIQSVRFSVEDTEIDILSNQTLYRYHIATGSLGIVARRHELGSSHVTDQASWLAEQQEDLFEFVREREIAEGAVDAAQRARVRFQLIPVKARQRIDNVIVSPDGRYLTFRTRERSPDRPSTDYIDYADPSGYATVKQARSKAGETRDRVSLGIVRIDATVPAESIQVTWVELPEAGNQNTVSHGPFWSPDGNRALLQFIGEHHQDLWVAELDVETGYTTVLTHDHDDAWIGGPPVQANYLQPTLLEWLPDGSFVFASERSGWSHLYRMDSSGKITALTEGEWEVRGATLNRARTEWLLQTSREHPSDDHLYRVPASGGELVRVTDGPGRHTGYLSPDGEHLAVVYSETTQLPDLFVGAVGSEHRQRITVSGTDAYYEHPLIRPTMVSFSHPDGDPIWAALFAPPDPHPSNPAVIHVHGGGYRQFAHRGWSVYGYALHLGFVNYLVQQGYTVLDFDYRGGAGFGRDYRTDIARSMGIKDADGVAAAARYLSREHGIDPERIGMHGVSYGGFLTLMTLFRHPGVVAAGIARASVTDWAHYSDGWTSRILGVPQEDPASYERSSPIYYADGLQDNLLITHGIVDDNVHFQDAVRLVQRLLELEKEFEVMFYPVEPHTIQTEASRYDFVRRASEFFDRHLRR